jgi:molecular chaperone DnaK (HSP70)
MKVGIDLGTTNSALAYIDVAEAADADFPPIHILPIPQAAAGQRQETLRTLPSFLFLAEQPVVGAYAREQGALYPTKTVHSAKSWLSNPEVDRTAKLLPWDAQEEGRVLSPVDASAAYLGHLRECWELAKGTQLSEQDVVLTVPASFDEEARELTVAAARQAGIEKLTLLEEPASAFYAWISEHLARSNRDLRDGQIVLICDVGGGTSDFTLVRVGRNGDHVEFTRTSVGRHLLLGGDNLDLALSWLAESKLSKQLSLRQRSALRRQCSAAKERMLSPSGPSSVEIVLAGSGVSLVGGTLRTSITRDEVLELALEGFLPPCQASDRPQHEKQSVFRELGLPYVSDPAITRHLAEFLASAPEAASGVDAVLFNGGFFIPDTLRARVADVLEHWYGRRPAVFENQELDLAVAMGAAYYGYVRGTGSGVLVRGGLPRAYYLGIDDHAQPDAALKTALLKTVCLVPRGAEEGREIRLEDTGLQLVANKAVAFRLYSSLSRTDDAAGEIVTFAGGLDATDPASDPRLHAPLQAVIRFGKAGERLIPIALCARLTEVGTLEVWADSKISEQRWRLEFQLRKAAAGASETAGPAPALRATAVVTDESRAAAEQILFDAFQPRPSPFPIEQLTTRLKQTLGLGRLSWPLPLIRALADRLLEAADGRRKNAAHESRWLNILGFCLRPGFGYAGDDFRVEQARRIYAAGLTFSNQAQCEIDWWIFAGRIAGGLNKNQQSDIFQRLSPVLLPKQKRNPRMNQSLYREMWRAAASLELLPAQTRIHLGDALVEMLKAGALGDAAPWCLSRIGARKLFHGPINQVLPPSTVSRWLDVLLRLPRSPALLDTMVQMSRQTGDATRDLPSASVQAVRKAIEGSPRAAELERQLTGQEDDLAASNRVFGEELPEGLVLMAPNA